MTDTRNSIEWVNLDHPKMPSELGTDGFDVAIRTGKPGTEVQLLLDDLGVILTVALKAGVRPKDVIEEFGDVDERDAPITRAILNELAKDRRREQGDACK